MRREAIPHSLPHTQLGIAGPPHLYVGLVHKDVAAAARTASGDGWLDEPEIGDAAIVDDGHVHEELAVVPMHGLEGELRR